MKARPLWQFSVATTAAAEDAMAQLLAGIFSTPAWIHCDVRKRTTTVSVFLDRPPRALAKVRGILQARLGDLARLRLDFGPARLRVRKLPPENWTESWKRHFKPIEVGRALLLKPSWSRRKPLQ